MALPINELITKKRDAVRLRLKGLSLAQVKLKTGLSVPTIIKAVEAFKASGWQGVESAKRGRKGSVKKNAQMDSAALIESLQVCAAKKKTFFTLDDLLLVYSQIHKTVSKKTLSRRLEKVLPTVDQTSIFESLDVLKVSDRKKSVLGFYYLNGHCFFYLQDRRGERRFNVELAANTLTETVLIKQLDLLLPDAEDRPTLLVVKTDSLSRYSHLKAWQQVNEARCMLIAQGALPERNAAPPTRKKEQKNTPKNVNVKTETKGTDMLLTHLQRLEAESIHIMREVVAEAENPVMLYSIGKDSAVMLHIAMKAFYPSLPPFPLLHVDTRWKFQEMYEFRDKMVKDLGLELITHINPEGVAKDINPFTHGSATHTDVMKTEGLKQALNEHKFDVAFGGARRDEEKSRAKERVFSFRTADHRWDPKNQRPEIWKQYNARKNQGESIRVFPISNWTELDIWQYIHLENIPIVPLYYSKERPVVERDGTLIMVDDERMPLKEGEVPMMKNVRFRTLGCYPLTGAVESDADTLPSIIQEMLLTKTSERQGRMIDHDSAASMEKKKQEGYF